MVKLIIILFIGLTFWKCPRRKVYAVQLRGAESSSDENEIDEPRSKKKKADRLDKLISTVNSIKSSIEDINKYTRDTKSKLPIGLQCCLQENFKCKICHSLPMQPPVVVAKCCKSILGCESCANSWYSGPDAMAKTCPLCRAERGFSETMILNGLHDFLRILSEIYSAEQDDQGDQVQGSDEEHQAEN